jgi:hypothetical protein
MDDKQTTLLGRISRIQIRPKGVARNSGDSLERENALRWHSVLLYPPLNGLALKFQFFGQRFSPAGRFHRFFN